jgi:3-deoxy-manno-octulosonate cytidylyltransferase (CMP-KDO synthetase)
VSGYAVLIPARYGSTRLPAKALLRESGKYLVQHVYERALGAPGATEVVVLTDDDRVEAAVRSFGGRVVRTSPLHRSGTDRCAEAARDRDEAVIVDLQGDEPFFAPEDLARLARAVLDGADLATLGAPFADDAARENPSCVKALVDAGGHAVAFQRSWPAHEQRVALGAARVLHHLGLYAFRRDRLLEFPSLPETEGERRERLEQLRALEHGWRIRVLDASAPAFGVDTRADYDEFLRRLRERE